MIAKVIAIILIVLNASACAPSAPKAYATKRDWLLPCVSPDGREYDVDHNDGHCRVGDDAKGCLVPNGTSNTVIYVRVASDTCKKHGGIEMGLHKTE